MHQDGAVQALHGLTGAGRFGADDDAVGLHEVLDAIAFGKEIGVAGHVKLDVAGTTGLKGLADDFGHVLGGTHRHCWLDDKHAVTGDVLAEGFGNVQDGSQVGRAVLVGGGIDGAEDVILIDEALLVIAGEC